MHPFLTHVWTVALLVMCLLGCQKTPNEFTPASGAAFETNGVLTEQLEVGRYTARLYRDAESGEGSLEIRHDRQQVYGAHGIKFSLEPFEDTPPIEPGTDITGDGRPNLVVDHWSGGAHCCMSKYIFQLGDNFKLLAVIDGRDGGVDLKNLDDEPDLEAVIGDHTFLYWKTAFAFSPMPRIVLKFDGEAYVIAADLMRMPRPDEPALAVLMEPFQKPEFWDQHLSQRSKLWTEMLGLMYSGHPDLAWRVLEQTWPEDVPGRDVFARDLRTELQKSPYFTQLPWADKADR